MRKIKAAILGYGNRGQVYADYSLDEPEELEISAIIDPNPYKLEVAKERYHLNDNQLFSSFNDFKNSGIEVDFVANTTMDQIHFETAKDVLSSGYNMLMEKPIVADKNELLELKSIAEKNNCKVNVCHVLRYTPFYRYIKTLINSGSMGKIISMEMNEHVWVPHYLTSYDRGKWNNEKECGSGFLLAKCCHDMDLICWLNNITTPKEIASFAHRALFTKENKPKESTEYCWNCPLNKTCLYSAMPLYYDHDIMPFLVLDCFNKPYDQITKEEKLEYLKKSNFGKCAYDCGGDIMDRQSVTIDFDNGSVATFMLSAASCKPDRYIHLVMENGEIEGKIEENKIVIRKYHPETVSYSEEEVDFNKEAINTAKYGGHSGGDYSIMHDLVRYLNGDNSSISITKLDDSINGHLVVYAAEESRKTGRIVEIDK